MARQRFIVVGGGLAGLAAVIKIAELGHAVDLFSIVPVKRSHSVCAQGGINGAVNTRGEGDSTWEHTDDTVYGGDFLANQPPIKEMCDWAPGVIYMLDRMGVPFNRTPEGLLDFRRFGGTKHHRTAFAGATTGQQLLYALDEQVRRYEADGLVTKYEHWEFLSIVRDEAGVCRGITAQDLRSMEIRAFPASAVALATGGPGIVFGRSTNSVINTGTAASAVFQQGALYANGEFIQVHPTAIPGQDKLRLMSESARGEGGRVWVPKNPNDKRTGKQIPENERFYFLEEWYPAYGNLVPRDIATRAIHKVVYIEKMGINGEPKVYLDLTHKPREELDRKLGGILEIYEKFRGIDPREHPMEVFPAMHYSMGGLWVDYVKNEKTGGLLLGDPRNHQTSIPGLYAIGEVDYQYHGANRLGANSLLSCIFAGLITGPSMVNKAKSEKTEAASSVFDTERKRQQDKYDHVCRMQGTENPFQMGQEFGEMMTAHVTVTRYNAKLQESEGRIEEMMDRYKRCGVLDNGKWANQSAAYMRHLWNMLVLARVITRGALLRDESRGAHYKPDFPNRDDERFLKTTIAEHTPEGPKMSYQEVDISLIKPRKRDYSVAKASS